MIARPIILDVRHKALFSLGMCSALLHAKIACKKVSAVMAKGIPDMVDRESSWKLGSSEREGPELAG